MKLIGRVVCFIPQRNFGFLHTADGREFFFHISNFKGTPALSQAVEFETAAPIREGKAEQAVNITPIDNTDVVSLLAAAQ